MIKILLDQNIPLPVFDWLHEKVGDAAEVTYTRLLGKQRMSTKRSSISVKIKRWL